MTSTPCAACKFLRRKCTQECVFAPYFPPTDPHKFAYVHRVFGASNVGKILNELPVHQREEAVNSLHYEAEARMQDPVYGCVGLISLLQQRLRKIQHDLLAAKTELAAYVGPNGVLPYLSTPGNPSTHFMNAGNNIAMPMLGAQQGRQLAIHEQNQQLQPQNNQLTVSDTQRMASLLLDGGDQAAFQRFDMNNNNNAGMVTVTGLNQTDVNGGNVSAPAPPPLALGSFNDSYQNNHHHQSQQMMQQTQLMLQPPVLEEQREAQFLIQSMMQQQPQPEPEPETETENEPQILVEEPTQVGHGRHGSEEASN